MTTGSRPPLIILTFPRSFSSVVCAMLGCHPEAFGFPELNLFVADTVGELLELQDEQSSAPVNPGADYLAGLLRAVAELFHGGQSAESLESAADWFSEHANWSTRDVLDMILDAVRPRVGIDKSTRTALSTVSLCRARSSCPQARYLHLSRHPIPTIRSLLSVQHRVSGRNVGDAWFYARLWVSVHEIIFNFSADLPVGRVLNARAEDLLQNPKDELARIARWLGLRDDQAAIAAMEHPENSRFAVVTSSRLQGDNDPDFLASPALRRVAPPPPLELPSDWNIDAGTWRDLVELSRRLGY